MHIVTPSFSACYIKFPVTDDGSLLSSAEITFNKTDIKMKNGVVHLINEVIFLDNAVKEGELISGATTTHHFIHFSILSLLSIILVLV